MTEPGGSKSRGFYWRSVKNERRPREFEEVQRGASKHTKKKKKEKKAENTSEVVYFHSFQSPKSLQALRRLFQLQAEKKG